MKEYKSFSELKEEFGDDYDFEIYKMGISALKEIEELQEENKKINQLKEMYHEKMLNFRMAYLKQQNRINEAIEYINKRKYKGYNFGNEMTGSEINHLLDILKGVE